MFRLDSVGPPNSDIVDPGEKFPAEMLPSLSDCKDRLTKAEILARGSAQAGNPEATSLG